MLSNRLTSYVYVIAIVEQHEIIILTFAHDIKCYIEPIIDTPAILSPYYSTMQGTSHLFVYGHVFLINNKTSSKLAYDTLGARLQKFL